MFATCGGGFAPLELISASLDPRVRFFAEVGSLDPALQLSAAAVEGDSSVTFAGKRGNSNGVYY